MQKIKINKKELRTNLLLLCFILLVCLAISEFVLRVFFPIPSYSYKPYSFQLDPEVGYKLSPNLDYQLKQPEFTINIKTNSYGFRDSDYSMEEIHDKDVVILGLGDSMTFGYGVEENETFLSLVQSNLIKKGIDAEIINTAVGGYGTIQEHKTAERYVPVFNPDIVILSYFIGNDVADNYNFRMDNKWSLIDGELIRQSENKLTITNRIRKISNHLYLVRYIKRILSGNSLVIKMLNLFRKGDTLDISYEQFNKSYSPQMTENWLRTKSELKQLNDYLKKKDIPLVLVAIPCRVQIDSSLTKSVAFSNNIQLDSFDFKKINKLLKKFSEQSNITFIDTTPLIETEGKKYYFKMDGHLNRGGHRLVFNAIFGDINRLTKNGK